MDMEKKREYLNKRISREEDYKDLLMFPRYLEIETVNTCNARCPMCTIKDWKRNYKPMADDLFAKISKEVIEHASEVKRVTLYRDGEPLIDKKLHERISFLKAGGLQSISISTNASLLTEERAKELLEAGIDIVIMSVDSLKKDVYERIRAGLKFEEVISNVLNFIRLRNKIRPGAHIWMRMIRQKDNFDEWPAYQKYWSELLKAEDRVYYHHIFNWGGQLKSFEPVADSREPYLPCVALWSLLVIFCNGDVPLCNADYNRKYPLGSVLTHTIKDLWQSKLLNEKRSLHLNGGKGLIDICKNCNVWDESVDKENISAQYADK